MQIPTRTRSSRCSIPRGATGAGSLLRVSAAGASFITRFAPASAVRLKTLASPPTPIDAVAFAIPLADRVGHVCMVGSRAAA
ncbi:hypothetical protein CH338_06370, partial [Rhodoplanes elegans]